jgi:D-alanyl-D-alanine carboxypeptidase
MTKIKLKKKNVFIAVSILVFIIIAIGVGVKIKKNADYRKTYEYKLLQIGYSKEDTAFLIKNMKKEEIDNVLTKDLNENIPKLLKEKYYLQKNLDQYLVYANQNIDKSLTEIIAIINVSANKEWYDDISSTDMSKDNLIIVNKFYQLSKDYEPSDLVDIKNWYAFGTNPQMRDEAYEKFIAMFNAAKEEKLTLIINSSYRNYNLQEEIYNSNKTQYGKENADKFVARPGHSEHQTGLAIDIFTYGANEKNFEEFDEFKWLQDNAYKYGFILRYPKDKEHLTGFAYESWHYRYVGIEAATHIYQNKITYDEYYAYFLAG